jgi:hypothetical protein
VLDDRATERAGQDAARNADRSRRERLGAEVLRLPRPFAVVERRPEPPPQRGSACVHHHVLQEDAESRLGRTAATRERRRRVKIDLDVRREDECRSDVVPGANELLETPAEYRFCLCLVDELELSRSHLPPPSLVFS